MRVAHLQDAVAVEGARQALDRHLVVPQPHAAGVAPGAGMQAGQAQRDADQRMDRVAVLEMEEMRAEAADALLVFGLQTQAAAQMDAPDPCLERGQPERLGLGCLEFTGSVCAPRAVRLMPSW